MLGNTYKSLRLETKRVKPFKTCQVRSISQGESLLREAKAPFILQKARANSGSVATVFGCSGFLGRYVVETLSDAGMYIITPFRTEANSVAHLKVLGEVGQVAPIRFDVRDRETLLKATEHADVVVNMVGRQWETRNFTYNAVHVDAAKQLAQAAKDTGAKRFIHFSAIGADVNSPSPFLRSKAEGEDAVRQIFPDATVLRLATVFGPEDNLLNKWGYLTRGSSVRVWARMEHKFQPVHYLNVADATLAVLQRGGTLGQTYELAGPKAFSIESLLRELVLPYMETQPQFKEYSFERAKSIVKWTEQLKNPTWLLSEVENSQVDLLPTEGSLGLKDLGITPTSIRDVSDQQLKIFKPVKRMSY